MPVYKGTKRITKILSYEALDKQIQKLEQFDALFEKEMGAAMEEAVGVAASHAKEDLRKKIKGESSGELEQSIYGARLGKSKDLIRGMIGTKIALKAFSQEVGRWYSRQGKRYYWKGKFYLYFGVVDRSKQIQGLYQQANDQIVNKLVVKS